MKRFWIINIVVQIIFLITCWFNILFFPDNFSASYKFYATVIGITLHLVIVLVCLIFIEFKKMPLSIPLIMGFILIIGPIIIVLGGWENDLQKPLLVAISLFAFSFTLKDALDYVDDMKNRNNKYFNGKVAVIIWGTLAFLIMTVIPLGDFVEDVNTDLLTFVSLGLVLAMIGVKEAKQKINNTTSVINTLNVKEELKELNATQQAELEKIVREFLSKLK